MTRHESGTAAVTVPQRNGARPDPEMVAGSVALLIAELRPEDGIIGGQFSASEVVGGWWRPSSGISRAARRRGEGPHDPLVLARAHARRLESLGDDRALAALRALQVGADPEWHPTVAAAAERLSSRGRREPTWWPPGRARVGRCFDVTWDVPDGRFDVVALEVFHGAQPLGLATVLDQEGTIVEVLVTDEFASLLEIPEEEGGSVAGDPLWRTPEAIGRRLERAIDRTDLLGPAPPPGFLPGSGYPGWRGLLRTWVALALGVDDGSATAAPVGQP